MLPFYSIHYITNNKMKYEWNIRMPIQDGTSASTTKWATNAFRIKNIFEKWDTILASWPFSIHDVIRRWHNMPPIFQICFESKKMDKIFYHTFGHKYHCWLSCWQDFYSNSNCKIVLSQQDMNNNVWKRSLWNVLLKLSDWLIELI